MTGSFVLRGQSPRDYVKESNSEKIQRPASEQSCNVHTVWEVRKSKDKTHISLDDGQNIELPPFTYVRAGDKVDVQFRGRDVMTVDKLLTFSPDGVEPRARLFPQYIRSEVIELQPYSITVTFRERRSKADWKAAKSLEQFHYRGNGLNRIVGRRTVLLADTPDMGIIGFGVLSATVGAAKPRFDLFGTNFEKQMKSKLINKIARIPRVVVHPEVRGLGIAVRLVRHLLAYAECHWDINGYKPIMVEVIASMTDYHRFFQVAGFIEAGNTLGYDKPIVPVYGKGSWEERPNASSYSFFEAKGPKPYLVYPLCREVRDLMDQKALIKNMRVTRSSKKPTLRGEIKFTDVSVTYRARNGITERALSIKEIFAVDGTQMYSPMRYHQWVCK
jgi:GNAT superfamily N-acetyltransferase